MSNNLKAALWMLGAIASFSAMAVAGREVSQWLDTFEIMTYRSLVGIVVLWVILTLTGQWRQVTRRSISTHVVRNAAHFTGQNLWFYAMTSIPLAQVFALEFTSPIWVVLLSPLILGEPLTRLRLMSVLVGFVGILIVARPSPDTISPGLIAAASSAVFFALSVMYTRLLTRTETVLCIMFWLTLMQAAFGIIFSAWDGDMVAPSAQTLPWLVLIGLAGLLAHYCLTSALAIAPATVVVPIDFVRLPTIAIVGMLLYGEALDAWVFVGATVIFAANYANIWYANRR
ncbi:DMT family transporter [Betaproteobacteria bacterium LSUCC0117]|nr:DMT family transporter [Betaproteobacteria bacterium LSUCC0117]MDP4670902.1 DMT family transporter [Burkholderiaceae bacterium]MDP4863073.1 DMT family transporter [Burkholderiaceae bacterium]